MQRGSTWAMARITSPYGRTAIQNQCADSFVCFTEDLHRLADWLASCGIQTLAAQLTGVYWIPLYEILDERGFEVEWPRHPQTMLIEAAKMAPRNSLALAMIYDREKQKGQRQSSHAGRGAGDGDLRSRDRLAAKKIFW